ncbi:hypothetical protein [Vibrio salinus]|uniref:hypothetical protein n=1 Tax=Vibrio salinus TaxID=2899784 RepID=UPI001E58509A|nr:hypothetical protein [Vibrio salinus]MCE0492506.1 hypothetical protein [Vibrio salinus]
MIRILAILVLIAVAYVLIRYDSNERLRKGVVTGILGALSVYIVIVVITELSH